MAHLENYLPDSQYQNYSPNTYTQTRANRNTNSLTQLNYPEQVPIENNYPTQVNQNIYRDQLDKAIYENQDRNAYDRMPAEEYRVISPQRVDRRETEIRQSYAAPEQYNNNYANNQYRGESKQARGRSEGYGPDQRNAGNVDAHSGQPGQLQQPGAYDQLMSKIKTNGYRQQNLHVWNMYHKAYEQKELDMKQFELNVVDKAAREKIIKDEARERTEWEKKQRLEKTTFDSNRKNLEMMVTEKRRQRETELVKDHQRVQDALAQFEREDQIKKQIMEKMKRENNMILDIQRRDNSAHRQTRKVQPRYGSNLLRNSIDNSGYEINHPEVSYATPLRNSGVKLRDRPEVEKPAHTSMMAKIADMSLKEPTYIREDESLQKIMKDDFASLRHGQMKEAGEVYQERPLVMNHSASAKDQYVKIRDRVRYGSAFNIITNEGKQQ